MLEFAQDTGLTSGTAPRRYLWTDAHAVSNFIALHAATPDADFLDNAERLVQQVHHVLGKHRPDDTRSGWISGYGDAQGARHPTAGGLRIGKPLPERRPDEPYDAQKEWDQDGQYYHYLTKWMHALHQMGRATGTADYARWANELAVAAFQGFKTDSTPTRLYWKTSIDLSRPLVPSSGLHDPLDGLVTALALQQASPDPRVDEVIAALTGMCRDHTWHTDDPLGLGGLLFDACRLAQLQERVTDAYRWLADAVIHAAAQGLQTFLRSPTLRLPAAHRLAFRELGLSIGLRGVALLDSAQAETRTFAGIALPLADHIERFWSTPAHQTQPTWREHEDINNVMLATSLLSPAMLRI
jgi:hypothetical protein